MQGVPILIAFFLIMTTASLLIPSPMFPGNLVSELVARSIKGFSEFFGAVSNGIFYGVISWIIFVMISRKLEE